MSWWTTLIAIIFILNYRSWPLMWHLRVGWIILKADARKFLQRMIFSIQSRPRSPSPQRLFRTMNDKYIAMIDDLDFNLHMSNSSYNKVLDYARTRFFTRHFLDILRSEKLYLPNAGVVSLFQKQIPPFTSYKVETRLLTFDEKWIFLIHRFISKSKIKTENTFIDNQGNSWIIHSHHLSKYVFKRGRKTISPIQVMELAGFIRKDQEFRQNDINTLYELANTGRDVVQGMMALDGLRTEW